MQTFPITELPYFVDSCIYFEQISAQSRPIFLDSGHPHSHGGRYDILSAQPYTFLTTYGQTTTISSPKSITQSERDPFHLLKEQLALHPSQHSHLPFNGGALGYFAYDLNKRIETLPDKAIYDIQLPDMAVGIYLWAVIVDHMEKKAYLLMPPKDKQPDNWNIIMQRLLDLNGCHPALVAGSGKCLSLHQTPQQVRGDRTVRGDSSDKLTSNLSFAQYTEKFAQIMQHIQQGDTYQINFAQRWQMSYSGDTWDLYQQLRQKNPAPFSAYIPLENGAILSCSPERFITINQGNVTTMPIKGTAKRERDPIQDKQAAQDLLLSEKNRAENIMIVDLMRNDLGKNCITGSVQATKLCELQSFVNVHHLVSTVRGELRADKHAIDVLRDCFPGGSITGAPKIRAMEIIDSYEPHRRHMYCGSIGYIDFNGNMDTNISIRTAVVADDNLYFWGGGGIVQDSQAPQEYQETLDKVQPFFDILLSKAEV